MLPTTIDEVLAALDQIIEESISEDNYLGVFAYVYRRTTAEIKLEVEKPQDKSLFEDNERMHDMDVRFANLYIRAYRDFKAGNDVAASWQVSFDAGSDRLALLQHLMLGMNAHINLDLANAASLSVAPEKIDTIKNDFMAVNEVLSRITNEMQERLGRVSPLLFILDWIGQRSDEKLADFSIKVARGKSWTLALELASRTGERREERLNLADENVASFGRILSRPATNLLRIVLNFIRRFESTDKRAIIDVMRS